MNPIQSITPDAAAEKLNAEPETVILDVRTLPEFLHRRIEGAVNIPVQELTQRYREVPVDKDIIVLCEHGIRSVSASQLLMQLGFTRIYNMLGGMSAWEYDTVSG